MFLKYGMSTSSASVVNTLCSCGRSGISANRKDRVHIKNISRTTNRVLGYIGAFSGCEQTERNTFETSSKKLDIYFKDVQKKTKRKCKRKCGR